MSRGPRSAPALVVLALVGAAGLVVWLAREDEDPARERERAAHDAAHVRAPRVDLAPVTTSPAAVVEAIERARAPRLDAAGTPGDGRRASSTDRSWDDVDPSPSLRGVRGLVRDARTKAPIAGAWLTWRVPSPEVCESVLRNLPESHVGRGLVTDTQGRFDVDRLPDDEEPSSMLSAVAPGYAPASVRPALGEEVVVELVPCGALEVRADEPVEVQLESVSGAPPGSVWLSPPGRPSRPSSWRVSYLTPGPWRALVAGREVAATDVVAGEIARLSISLPPQVPIEGALLGGDGSGLLTFHVLGTEGTVATGLLDVRAALPVHEGRFAGALRPGRYAVSITATASWSERRVVPSVVDVLPGMPPLALEVPPASERLEVLLVREGQPVASDGLGLVWLDLPEDDPSAGDLLHVAPTGEPGLHAVVAAPGRYALFDGGDLLAPSVVLPAAGRLVVDLREATCRLRFRLPTELRPDEVVRARVVLVPEVLARRPAMRQRFAAQGHVDARVSHAAPSVDVPMAQPGRYLLVGESDLGSLEVWVDLTAGAEVTVPLGE